MCCDTQGHHGWGRHHGGSSGCGCGCDETIQRRPRFLTKEQKIARLEGYLDDLREEARAVEEHIAEMKEQA